MSKTYPTVEEIMHNTDFKDKETALAALDALLWLEAGAPHKFSDLPGEYSFHMGHFITPADHDGYLPNNICGTACCIAGAIELHKKKGDVKEQLNSCDLENLFVAECGTDLYDLFYVMKNSRSLYRVSDGDDIYLEEVKPHHAAKALYGYLTTGVVDWSSALEPDFGPIDSGY